jgi:hypothetical protein
MTNPGIAHVPADAIMLMHLAFVLFVVLGGLLVLRWRRIAWLHLPSVAWGAGIEFTGGICLLTPLENWLRERAGDASYTNSFVEHCVVPLIYPTQLTRNGQLALGVAVLVLNASVYWGVIRQRR